MLGLFLGFAFYSFIENEIKYSKIGSSKKIINNFLSIYHILSTITLSIAYFLLDYNYITKQIILYNSCSFFFYDALTFIKDRNVSINNIILIYHHIVVSLYMLNSDINSNWYAILIFTELSNIPGNVIYHYLQLRKKGENHAIKIELLKFVQLYIYSFLRCIVVGYYMYNELIFVYSEEKNGNIYYYLCTPLYFMGCIWSYILYKAEYKKRKLRSIKNVEKK